MVTGLLFVSLLFGSPGSVGGLAATDQGIDPAIATTAAHLALAVFSAAFAALALLFWQRERVTRILALLTGRRFPRLQRHLISFLDRLTQGFECLRDVSGASKYLVVTAIYWSLYALSIWSIIRCAGIGTIGIIEVCAVTGLLSLGFTLQARNAQNVLTQNYTGAYAQLNLASAASLGIGARSGASNLTPAINVAGPTTKPFHR